MMFAKGNWNSPNDLKNEDEEFSVAFARFLDSNDCPPSLKEIVAMSKKYYEKKLEKDRKKCTAEDQNLSQDTESISGSQLTDSQDSVINEIRLGQELLRDIHNNNNIEVDEVFCEPPLFDGGPDFDWNAYAKRCLNLEDCEDWPENTTDWLEQISEVTENQILEHANNCTLPSINLLLANPLQRVIIGMNLERFLDIKENGSNESNQLRLLVQGFGGTGKTFTINAITYITRRLFQRNGSVLNLAPTGAASNLIPDGRTVHSITPPLSKSKKKEFKTANMNDYPLSHKSLKKLRTMIDYKEDKVHNLYCLNMDERSMYSHRLLAWSSQRFCEATEDFENCFGNIPVVNFYGDLAQLGPIDAKDLHVPPGKNSAPDEFKGYSIYRSFTDCVVLTQTMRQKPDQKSLLDRLLRIRTGHVTQQDWLDINSRFEKNLSQNEKKNFQHDRVITLHETWREVNKENREQLSKLGVPVATIPSTGRGRHHVRGDKPVGQIPSKCIIAVGCRVMLTKNQGPLTSFGLNNGSMGKVIAILYEKDKRPPSMPTAVVVHFYSYSGPAWNKEHPKWVPIKAETGRCDQNCCSRTGLPLVAGYSIPIAKAQGMTVGNNKPATHMRIKLQQEKFMEALSLGTSYTAFSRVESENRWCLIEEIPMDRITYVNQHPHMPDRRAEESRLKKLSDETVSKYKHYADGTKSYVLLLQQLDAKCNDGLSCSTCVSKSPDCPCILCQK